MTNNIKNFEFRINYKYQENSNAYNNQWNHNYVFLRADNEQDVINAFYKLWESDSEVIIKNVIALTPAA